MSLGYSAMVAQLALDQSIEVRILVPQFFLLSLCTYRKIQKKMRQHKYFIDYAKITITSGAGGDGAITFRKEKFVSAGGPNGGDGGKGGDVRFVGTSKMRTLLDFKYLQHFKAEPGEKGGGKDCYGKKGEHLIIRVPVGTVIKDTKGNILADMVEDGQEYIALKGGKGGRGNAHFANAKNKTPRFSEPGGPSHSKDVILELKVLADIGLVGLPNVGKSTLLSVITNATPKIADYEFTTLEPNLGAVSFNDREGFIIADIPGLIEGAHKGVGLGHDFLRHLERTKLLVHLIDINSEDPFKAYKTIRTELELYPFNLSRKEEIIVLTKIDLCDEEHQKECKEIFEKEGLVVYPISAAAHKGLKELLKLMETKLREQENLIEDTEFTTIALGQDEKESDRSYKINKIKNDFYEVECHYMEKVIELTEMSDSNAMYRFQTIIEKMGINQALRDAGAANNDTVKIGNFEFTYYNV